MSTQDNHPEGPPDSHAVEVATGALRAEAHTWDQQSQYLAQIAARVQGLRLDRIEAGLFQLVVDAYQEVITQVNARSGEGRDHLSRVADTLHQVADTYEREEQENLHRLRNAY